jgi:hypothetical protein
MTLGLCCDAVWFCGWTFQRNVAPIFSTHEDETKRWEPLSQLNAVTTNNNNNDDDDDDEDNNNNNNNNSILQPFNGNPGIGLKIVYDSYLPTTSFFSKVHIHE